MSVETQRTTWALTQPGEMVSFKDWLTERTQLGVVIAIIDTFTQIGVEIWVLWSEP
jgi:hypothetical protein